MIVIHTIILSEVPHKLSGSDNILIIWRDLGSQWHSDKTESRIREFGKCDLSHQVDPGQGAAPERFRDMMYPLNEDPPLSQYIHPGPKFFKC
jgi:hypothetical protein